MTRFFWKKDKNFVGGEQTFFFQSHLYRFTNFDFEELAKTSLDAQIQNFTVNCYFKNYLNSHCFLIWILNNKMLNTKQFQLKFRLNPIT